jgi:hypothetical protein
MFQCLTHKAKRFIFRHVVHDLALREIMSIPLERHRRAVATTVDYIERYMQHVDSVRNRIELLAKAFKSADVSGNRLICEFGVYRGDSINFIARMTDQRVFGFDSFEGLPERWFDGWEVGAFAVSKLPKVRRNVTLVKGWFNETLPGFLKENPGDVGFLHVDSDLYSSAKTIFELLEPRLKPGTVIVFDEYFNFPQWEQGEHKAFTEFLERTGYSVEHVGYTRNDEQLAVILREKK